MTRGRPAAVLLMLLCACSAPPPGETTPVATESAPEPAAEVVSLDRLAEVLKGLRGNPVVLNFWATWCPPCVTEMPELARFHANSAGRAHLVSVSVDHPDTVESRLTPFLKERSIPFPVYVIDERTPSAVSRALALDWRGGAVPATFLLDKDGRVRESWDEEVTESQLMTAIRAL